MAFEFDHNGYPVWRQGMTSDEKREYRKLKHRAHAARSRRLRGKDAPYRAQRGVRTEYPSGATCQCNCNADEEHVYPCAMYPTI